MATRKTTPATERATATATAQNTKAKQAAIVQAFDLGFSGARADAATLKADCDLLQVHAIKGQVPDHIAKAYKAGVIAERLNKPQDAETLAYCLGLMEKGVKRSQDEQAAILAANNRYSRRLGEAGLKSGNSAGAKRGTKRAATKATATKATATPAPATKATTPAPATKATTPTLVNETEVMAYLQSQLAAMKGVQRKNAKSFTAKARNAVKAFEAALRAE